MATPNNNHKARLPLITPEDMVVRHIQDCQEEIQEILKKHNCALDCSMTLGQGIVEPKVFVVYLEKKVNADGPSETKIPMPPVNL